MGSEGDLALEGMNAPTTQTQWIQYLDTVAHLSYMQAVKQEITEHLELHAGDIVLDAGCGTGDDARAMVARISPNGRVIGLDLREETLAEARQRHADVGTSLEFVQGDVHRLLFADATFTTCRAERMFQHLEEPRRALSELARVTRSGGRIVIYDTDWETLIVDGSDVTTTRAILQAKCDQVRHGWIGRQLAGLMHEVGLGDIAIVPSSLILTDGPLAIRLHYLQAAAEHAQRTGHITSDQCNAWFEELLRRHEEGRFFSSVTAFIVCGRKP